MPTFTKGIGERQDNIAKHDIGLPLLDSIDNYEKLNDQLKQSNIALIIKIHPKQDLNDIKVKNKSNIFILSGQDVKRLGVDNYRLMKDVDALISDYSSAAYDFLHMNKPIAYDMSDLKKYTRGIVVEDPTTMLGDIYSMIGKG